MATTTLHLTTPHHATLHHSTLHHTTRPRIVPRDGDTSAIALLPLGRDLVCAAEGEVRLLTSSSLLF